MFFYIILDFLKIIKDINFSWFEFFLLLAFTVKNERKRNMKFLSERISVDSGQCGGCPCVRGMRIRVSDVLDLLASGMSVKDVLKELPDLEEGDIAACLQYASKMVDHPVVAA